MPLFKRPLEKWDGFLKVAIDISRHPFFKIAKTA